MTSLFPTPFSRARRQWLQGLLTTVALSLTIKPLSAAEKAEEQKSDKPEDSRSAYREVSPPRKIPILAFTDQNGTVKSLLDFRGKTVLLSLWATWCPPCIAEMPYLDRLRDKMESPDFTVLPIAIRSGDKAGVQQFYEQHGIKNLPIYLENSGAMITLLGGIGIPFALVLNEQGEVVGEVTGGVVWDSLEAQALLSTIIMKNKAQTKKLATPDADDQPEMGKGNRAVPSAPL